MIDPEEERAKFISLREALALIAQAKGKNPREAIEMLWRNLNDSDYAEGLEPRWFHPECGMVHGTRISNDLLKMLRKLHVLAPDRDIHVTTKSYFELLQSHNYPDRNLGFDRTTFMNLLGRHYEGMPTLEAGTGYAANLGQPVGITDIAGATFARLKQAIDAFPEEYPGYRERPPKLDADIRVWLGKELGCSEREKHVFGQIIAEHFGLIQSA